MTLITEQQLKEFSLFPNNYNLKEIWNFVPIAENLYIEPLIGEDLYNELLNEVTNNTVTDDNKKLLEQIYPYEGLCVVETTLPYISMHITQVGITKGKSENSESVSLEDINYLTNYVRSQMEPLKNKLIKWLKNNKKLYPLYKEPFIKTWDVYGLNPINTDVDFNKLVY